MVKMKLEAKTVDVPEDRVYLYKQMGYERVDDSPYSIEPEPAPRKGKPPKAAQDDAE